MLQKSKQNINIITIDMNVIKMYFFKSSFGFNNSKLLKNI